MSRRQQRALGLAVLAALGGALGGCGGDPAPAPGSAERPLVARTPDGSSEPTNPADRKRASRPGYEQLVEQQKRHPRSRFTPCNLVTKAQARHIVGGSVQEPVEAPQGPTCIYRAQQGNAFITLAVQRLDFSQLKSRLRDVRTVEAAGRKGYCGRYGQQMLYVPLSGSKVLTVSGPCSITRRFAAQAVRELSSR